MTAYYNEIDPFAAAWLRELIKAGHIAPGEVDTRSIADVMPSDLAGFTQCHFFAGIGVWSYALRQAGWADDRPVWTGSCPCQPFSSAGKGKGFKDERHLWPEFYRLISQCRPTVCLGEQVASKDGLAWVELVQNNMEGAGYAFGAVDTCSASFGAPHIRQRLYWVGADTLGNSSGKGLEGRGGFIKKSVPQRRERTDGYNPTTSSTCGLAHAEHQQHQGRVSGCAEKLGEDGGWQAGKLAGCCEAIWLAHADNTGRQLLTHAEPAGICGKASCQSKQVQQPSADSSGISGGVADTAVHGHLAAKGSPHVRRVEQFARWEEGQGECLKPTTACSAVPWGLERPCANPTNGFWRDADWLLCRDGKWRATQSIAIEMADGLADRLGYSRFGDRWSLNPLIQKAENRVGRLKGYGNAINAEQAKAFIEAFMEVN